MMDKIRYYQPCKVYVRIWNPESQTAINFLYIADVGDTMRDVYDWALTQIEISDEDTLVWTPGCMDVYRND